MDKLITETHTNSSISVFHQFATYATQQLPYMWVPSTNPFRIIAVASNLRNVRYNALFTLLPEYWQLTK